MSRPTRTKQGNSIMRREIFSQPQVLSRVLERETGRVERLASRVRRRDPQLVLIVARGSADNAGLYGKYLFGAHNRKVVALATPSLFTQYRTPPDVSRALVVAISQSGESQDVVEVVEAAGRAGALTVALTNTAGSPLARAAQEVLLCHAGRERSVAATKTYTAQVLLLALLSNKLAGSDGGRMRVLASVPERVAEALEVDPEVRTLAERLRYLQHCAVVGRGYCYGTAFEVALKLAELTYIVAQPYSFADFQHGPIAVVDPGFCVVIVAPGGRLLKDARQLLDRLVRRRAEVIALSDHAAMLRRATCGIRLPSGVPEWIAPLTSVIPGQLLAMHLAGVKGLPVDTPRGLTKVTRTR